MDLSEISDYKAEAGVISTLVYHPEFILHSNYLHEKYFYNVDNACIYWAIKELFAQKITNITALNIEQMLDSNKAVKKKVQEYNLPSIQEYIDLCFNTKRDSVEEYLLLVNRVVELAFKRSFYKKASDWQRMCSNEDVHLDDMSNTVYKELNELTTSFVTDGEITTFGSKIKDIWQKIKEKKERGESYGLPSFFPSINEFFTYEETELVVIEARMKKGKSWLAMIEALHKAMNGVPTFVQDSEMSDENWYIRVLSYLSGVPVYRIKGSALTIEEESKIEETNAYIEDLPLFHNFDPYITKERFYSICAQKKIEMGLKFVIWDYIKCDDSILNSAERSAYMAGIANWLKNIIAGDLKMSVLAFCQLNRSNEVAESDGIEKYCSVAVKWEEKTNEELVADGKDCGTHKLTVKLNRLGKQHMGENDYIDMMFTTGKVGIKEAKQHTESTPFS
ncbi:DnaB-like helicase C-terminal domain-containing protein [Clostridium sp. HBUAS56010]|uniref:DnaB-like helicase C-terminal domain-containing protein n=1 Tax=Clostridium sp. HBUAS56010 TaxID=2571127 RepID=UPI00117766E7|nr:DnaB-like helicase C-terminal domain-containing protein [Clostridium sp. HBUAS56010]